MTAPVEGRWKGRYPFIPTRLTTFSTSLLDKVPNVLLGFPPRILKYSDQQSIFIDKGDLPE